MSSAKPKSDTGWALPLGPRWPGMVMIGIAIAHLLVGTRQYSEELQALPKPVPDAPLWFMTTGASLLLLGADVAFVPDAVAQPARRLRGAGVMVIATAIISQRRRSGAWALLPAGIALAFASQPRPVSSKTEPTRVPPTP